jgi:methyl-accepting chemotaxis protein
MKKNTRCTLQRTMITYFLLIGFASTLMGVEFFAETRSARLQAELLANFRLYGDQKINADELFQPINRLRNKALLMIFTILAVVAIVVTMFIKNITEPLQHMIEVSHQISKGDLSRTVLIEASNELKELGGVINEMSSNLQEIMLLSQNLCYSVGAVVSKTRLLFDQPHVKPADLTALKQDLAFIDSDLSLLSGIIDYFSFYKVDKPRA